MKSSKLKSKNVPPLAGWRFWRSLSVTCYQLFDFVVHHQYAYFMSEEAIKKNIDSLFQNT